MTLRCVVHILFPDYIELRTAIRLTCTSIKLRNEMKKPLDGWVAYYCAKASWVKVTPTLPFSCFWDLSYDTAWRRRWLTCQLVHSQSMRRCVIVNNQVFKAFAPSTEIAWYQLQTKLCRECFTQTRAKALTSGGNTVFVCVACSCDADGYSCMVDRKIVLNQLRPTWLYKARVLKELASLQSPRRGGNRAILYWKHDVLKMLSKIKKRKIEQLVC